MATPTLDEIAAHGNRGHVGFIYNNHIECKDGTTLSVIAGGGTYSIPRPALCLCAYHPDDPHISPPIGLFAEVDHDYPGPYSSVEVMGGPAPEDDVDTVSVEEVRQFIEDHGGEVEPLAFHPINRKEEE